MTKIQASSSISWIVEQGRVNACIAFIKKIHQHLITISQLVCVCIYIGIKDSCISATTFIHSEFWIEVAIAKIETRHCSDQCLQILNTIFTYWVYLPQALIRSSTLKALFFRRGHGNNIKVINKKKKKLENFHSKHNLMMKGLIIITMAFCKTIN